LGFGQAVRTCLGNYAVFAGRARRSEYWWFTLFGLLASAAAAVLDVVAFPYSTVQPLSTLLSLGLLLPSLAVGVRRLHDTGRSGWWMLIGLLPVLGMIVLIVLFCQKSAPEPNRYGPAPLAVPG
jgi:uncharacterized membrane protein YhaH (DUF805 family)